MLRYVMILYVTLCQVMYVCLYLVVFVYACLPVVFVCMCVCIVLYMALLKFMISQGFRSYAEWQRVRASEAALSDPLGWYVIVMVWYGASWQP